jgi:hypothetical protein
MDAERFDSLARSLAGRLSRRTALRGASAGIAGSVLATLKIQPGRAAPARQTMAPAYIVVRQYQPSASVSDLQQALSGYAPMLAEQSGFIGYSVIETEGGIASITVFDSQQNEGAAANALGDWVQQNLASLLPEPTATISGDSFVQAMNRDLICAGGETPTVPAGTTPTPDPTAAAPTEAAPTATAAAPTATTAAPTATALPVCTDPSRPGVGCECSTGTENPCGDTTLVCCANDANAAPGAPGTCTPSSVGCDPTGPTPTVAPSPTPCTGIGCPCTAGVEGTCDAGLVCCQSQMNAPNQPGGPGQCATQDGCGNGGDGGDGGDGNGAGATPTA